MKLRSFANVVGATFQPSFAPPTTLALGMRTSVRKVSLKCWTPVICVMGRTSMPGDFMSRMKYVMPACLG